MTKFLTPKIEEIISTLCNGSKAQFCNKLGILSQTLNSWLSRPVGARVVNQILMAFPNVRKEWLLDDSGEMLNPNIVIEVGLPPSGVIYGILENEGITAEEFANDSGLGIRLVRGLMNDLSQNIPSPVANQIIAKYPHYNKRWVVSGCGEMLNGGVYNMEGDTVGERIDILRMKLFGCGRGSMKEFANALGENQTTVTNWVKRGASAPTIAKICTAFPDVNGTWLANGTGEAFRNKGGVPQTTTEQPVIPTAVQPLSEGDTKDMLIVSLQAQLAEKDKQISELLSIIRSKM